MKLFVLPPALSALGLVLAGPALAEPIRSVTLYETGLAEIGLVLPGDDTSTLQVDQKNLDDILKSLTLRGEGLDGARISLPSGDHRPSPLDAPGGTETILEALTGQVVTFPARQLTGTILRIGNSIECGEHGCGKAVTVMRASDGALVSMPVTDSLEIIPEDKAASEALAKAALRPGQAMLGLDTREITIETRGGSGDVSASYVIASPVWSTSWRAETGTDGKVAIEAWAVIRNATATDWKDVDLTLSSGAPRAIAADLYATRWGYREDGPPAIGLARGKTQAFAAMADMEMSPAPMAAGAAPTADTDLREGLDALFSFREPIDLAAGEILSLPLVTGDFDAKGHTVWSGGNGYDHSGNPDRILELTNTLPVRVPAGIMTIRDADAGFVGDSRVPMMAPGETHDLAYGKELMVDVDESVRSDISALGIRITGEGVLVEDLQVVETVYGLSAKGEADRTVLIRHPVGEGWNIRIDGVPPAPGLLIKGPDGEEALEISMELAPGTERRLEIRAESPVRRIIRLEEVDAEMLTAWLEREPAEAETTAWLRAALEIRQSQLALEDESIGLAKERDTAAADQSRIAGLLSVLDRSTAEHGRFSADLVAREDRIRDIDARLDEIRQRMQALDRDLAGLPI